MAIFLHLVLVGVAQAAVGQMITTVLGPYPWWVWGLIGLVASVGAWYTRPQVVAWMPVLIVTTVVAGLYAIYPAWDTIVGTVVLGWNAVAAWATGLDAAAIGEAIGNGITKVFTFVGGLVVFLVAHLWYAYTRQTQKHALQKSFTLAEIARLITGVEPTVPTPDPLVEEYGNLRRDVADGTLVTLNPEEADMQEVEVGREDLREYLSARGEHVPRFLTERYDWLTAPNPAQGGSATQE